MKITKNKFCRKHNIEDQWVRSLCDYGIIPYTVGNAGKVKRVFIDEESFYLLKPGYHYVECPFCGKKLSSVTKKHYAVCGGTGKSMYCGLLLLHKKKTEEQKAAQSKKLKNRFKTKAGKITLRQITVASRKLNSDPEFIKRKRVYTKEVQNRPEIKKMHRKMSKKMWKDPDFIKRHRKYVRDNIEELRKSAANARSQQDKTSALHLSYKSNMEDRGIKGFITEYVCDYYSIDEADPFAKIAVEIDGCYWHGCKKCGFEGVSEIKATDNRKNAYLKNRGWFVIRIKEHEIKKDPFCGIEMIRTIQERRRALFSEKIKESFKDKSLKVKSLFKESSIVSYAPISDVFRHKTPHKKILFIQTETDSIKVTEDHSLFLFSDSKPVISKSLVVGDKIIGMGASGTVEPLEIVAIVELPPEEFTYDLSVPESESFVLKSGILAHNSYSISGVNLDIEKSSKYESMKRNFYEEADKAQELAKRSIKITKGLKQPRYGVGISSALGPYSKPGTQSRRNFIGGGRGGWS
jgi:very-short-patch-repair endonuclease